MVWQAPEARDRFTAIQFTPDGRFKESNVARYLGLAAATAADVARTGRWRLLGRYTLELRYDDTGRAEHVSVMLDPFEQASPPTLYLGQQPFAARRQ